MERGRGILQTVGSPPDLLAAAAKRDSDSDLETEELDKTQPQNSSGRTMNMKQEGPFLVPQLWKDNLNLDNLTNDFLESNVTGEVMNLDDFLKELQVNELTDSVMNPPPPAAATSPPAGASSHQLQSPLRGMGGAGAGAGLGAGHGGQDQDRFQHNLIRPANIENLKETQQQPGQRPSIMHHVGKPPELNIKYGAGQHELGPGHPGMPPVSLPYRDPMQSPLLSSHKDGHHHGHGLGPGHPQHHPQVPQGQGQGQGQGIPQASVRPLVRPMAPEKHEPQDQDIKPPVAKRKRKLSECSNFTDDDDEGGIGSFTSTVCVNFSEDDLRLATIPGQVEDFDPATRRFSEEELKPQPIIRKRKKQFVPDELKNNKYWAKRYKNNEAAKRSREARRLKENQIAMRARYLEEENTALKGEVDVLKKENSDLKQMMMALEEKMNQMSNNR